MMSADRSKLKILQSDETRAIGHGISSPQWNKLVLPHAGEELAKGMRHPSRRPLKQRILHV